MAIINTFSLIVFVIVLVSFISLISLSHDTSTSSLRNSKIGEVTSAIEKHVANLENEISKLEKMTESAGKLEEHPRKPLDFSDASKPEVKEEVEKEDVEIAASEHNSETNVFVDADSKAWRDQLFLKLKCLRLRQGALYLYHVRKAAGTSIRDVLHLMSRTWRVPVYETEGIVLDQKLFDHHGMTSVITLREPVSRVMSLYWYEHVGWYDGILKQTAKCKTLKEWVTAWRDGSEWKNAFVKKNPGTVYVEIENYYVKMLTGWSDSSHKIDENDYLKAKEVLRRFDLVFLTDWMGDDTQVDAMNAVFPGRTNVALGHKIRGDFNARTKLTPLLAPDEVRRLDMYFL